MCLQTSHCYGKCLKDDYYWTNLPVTWKILYLKIKLAIATSKCSKQFYLSSGNHLMILSYTPSVSIYIEFNFQSHIINKSFLGFQPGKFVNIMRFFNDFWQKMMKTKVIETSHVINMVGIPRSFYPVSVLGKSSFYNIEWS